MKYYDFFELEIGKFYEIDKNNQREFSVFYINNSNILVDNTVKTISFEKKLCKYTNNYTNNFFCITELTTEKLARALSIKKKFINEVRFLVLDKITNNEFYFDWKDNELTIIYRFHLFIKAILYSIIKIPFWISSSILTKLYIPNNINNMIIYDIYNLSIDETIENLILPITKEFKNNLLFIRNNIDIIYDKEFQNSKLFEDIKNFIKNNKRIKNNMKKFEKKLFSESNT
ncbi:MAG: hypothetical protein QXO21_00015 [Candidatus Anstonellales archaeon]